MELFRYAQRLIDAGEVDIVILAARRLACLYHLLLRAGMEPIRGCVVVSDRFLDVATKWEWAKALILDDSVVVGTTLLRLTEELRARVGADGNVRSAAVCVDVDQRASFLLESLSFVALEERKKAEVQQFSTDIVIELFRHGIPFFSDFPVTRPIKFSSREWKAHLADARWFAADVTAPLLGERGRAALVQIPTDSTIDKCLAKLVPEAAALVEGFKVRSYVEEHRGAVIARFVPIAMLAPCSPAALDAALEAIARPLRPTNISLPRWRDWTPIAKHRLVQLYAAACVMAELLDTSATQKGVPNVDKWLLDAIPASFYFGTLTDEVLELFDAVVATYDRSEPLDEAVRPAVFVDRPSQSPLLYHDDIQDILWETRELFAHSGLPEAPNPGQLTKIGLIFAHGIASIFGFINQAYEEPQRAEIARLRSRADYDDLFGKDESRRILNQGFTLRELTAALAPDCLGGAAWSRALVSLGVDIGNDLGIIVPVTQYDSSRGLVYRCYRLGETAHLASQPLPRAASAGEWDDVARTAASGYPMFSQVVPISGTRPRRWPFGDRNRSRILSEAATFDSLRSRVLEAVPGRIAARFDGTVTTVLEGGDFHAELSAWPGDDQRVAIMRIEQVKPSDRQFVRPGARFSWTVFECENRNAFDRTSRIRIRSLVPLDLAAMRRSASAFAYLAEDDADPA